MPSIQTPDQILSQTSEACLDKSIGSVPAGDLSNQFPVDNVPRPQAAGVGLTRSKLLSKPYSFAGSSGIHYFFVIFVRSHFSVFYLSV